MCQRNTVWSLLPFFFIAQLGLFAFTAHLLICWPALRRDRAQDYFHLYPLAWKKELKTRSWQFFMFFYFPTPVACARLLGCTPGPPGCVGWVVTEPSTKKDVTVNTVETRRLLCTSFHEVPLRFFANIKSFCAPVMFYGQHSINIPDLQLA